MRSNRLMFTVLFGLGIAIMLAAFFVFLPAESRTNTRWLDFFVILLVYTGLWGRYSIIFPAIGGLTGRVPVMAVYWICFPIYAIAAIAAMMFFEVHDVAFGKQILVQICLLFAFVVAIAVGKGASNFIQAEQERTESQISGILQIRRKAAMLQAIMASLPPQYTQARAAFDEVVDAATYTGGRSNDAARPIETRIINLLDTLETQCTAHADPGTCLATISAASASLKMLKSLPNA